MSMDLSIACLGRNKAPCTMVHTNIHLQCNTHTHTYTLSYSCWKVHNDCMSISNFGAEESIDPCILIWGNTITVMDVEEPFNPYGQNALAGARFWRFSDGIDLYLWLMIDSALLFALLIENAYNASKITLSHRHLSYSLSLFWPLLTCLCLPLP